MYLRILDETTTSWWVFNSIVHELGHAAGLLHERDRNISGTGCAPIASLQEYRRLGIELTLLEDYDRLPIMGCADGQENLALGLSPGDIATLRKIYGVDGSSVESKAKLRCSSAFISAPHDDPSGSVYSLEAFPAKVFYGNQKPLGVLVYEGHLMSAARSSHIPLGTQVKVLERRAFEWRTPEETDSSSFKYPAVLQIEWKLDNHEKSSGWVFAQGSSCALAEKTESTASQAVMRSCSKPSTINIRIRVW